ncbi:hypothetical protein RR46_10400 [Papilio xuthus]|uniref:MD-2-related lipid-recognition domain-containing protein n=1 Tax=Papilio xuthus TaxID=66420 RepID=A0A194Q0H6_PAPXU|nr:hypothetical protein RR46_10400 [Papilio xuthus]
MLRIVVFLCVAAAAVTAQTTSVTQCSRNPGELPLNAHVEGCLTPPCLLPQLQDAVINVVFHTPRVLRSMTTRATALLQLGAITLPVEYNLAENADTCRFLTNTYCPLLAGEVVSYTLRMFIEPFFPVGTSLNIEFRVVDDSEEPVWCIRMPIQIVAPLVARSAPAITPTSNSTLSIHT